MIAVKKLPCCVRHAPHDLLSKNLITPCSGRVEADHAGRHGLGQKADDRTCIPMCRAHHRERTDYRGTFRGFDANDMRRFCAWAIEATGTSL